MRNSIKPPKWLIVAFLVVPVVWYVFSVFIPLIAALFYSFFNWKGGPSKTFAGVENYIRLFQDTTFWQSFVHNIYIVVVCIVGQVGIAFVLVLMVNSRQARFKEIHRTFGFFPSTISAVYIGLIWTMIFDYKRGILNYILNAIGRNDATQVWLNNPEKVLQFVSIPLVWQFIGYYMVILMSAIAAIDSEIFDEAELDGANAFQRAVHIVLPLIKNTLLVCITLCVAGNMKVFDHIYTMTAGGPGTSSMVMALYGYKVSFEQGNMGYGSAISVAIFVVSLVVIGAIRSLINYIMRDKEAY
ncbi:MAG: sugar ABC transporter permease [Treponema sp.]|nr:sugar ABC transporter permease [Treponema sp.]